MLNFLLVHSVDLWNPIGANEKARHLESYNYRNALFHSTEGLTVVEVNPDVVDILQEGFTIQIPITRDYKLECTLRKGIIGFPSHLPNSVEAFGCSTGKGSEFHLIHNKEANTLSGTFFDYQAKTFYFDLAFDGSKSHYVLYNSKLMLEQDNPPFHNFTVEISEFSQDLSDIIDIEGRRLEDISPTDIFVYRIAFLTSEAFSAVHGNTIASVSSFILNALSRVNGIYLRQVGVYFELIDNFEMGICLAGDKRETCSQVFNSNVAIGETSQHLTKLGIAIDTYDIAQTLFSSGAGGKARLGGFCGGDKGYAASPSYAISLDASTFVILFFAHEIGHQLGAKHTYRDCTNNNNNNLFPETAVEPGGGSTLMSFGGGICGGSTNIVKFRDGYFHSTSVKDLRKSIINRHQSSLKCGRRIAHDVELSALSVPDQCIVPLGNNYVLVGYSTKKNENEYYSWDRVDPGVEDYSEEFLGRFRSYEPVRNRNQRYFPNLHYLNFKQDRDFEILPEVERSMVFRFTAYNQFSLRNPVKELSTELAGAFVQADTEVEFINFEKPLRLLQLPSLLPLNQGFKLSWEISDEAIALSPDKRAQIFFAENTMEPIEDEKLIKFDYVDDVHDLHWIFLKEVDLTSREACILLHDSFIDLLNLDLIKGNIIIRMNVNTNREASVRNNAGCFVFDLLKDVKLFNLLNSDDLEPPGTTYDPCAVDTLETEPSQTDIGEPDESSTEEEIDLFTHLPTGAPTLNPIRDPTSSPTNFPTTSNPTGFPTITPTPFPTLFPSVSPTQFPTKFPTSFPTAFPIVTTASPTQFPTKSPSTSPTEFPSTSPTNSPTPFPST